MGEAKRRKQLDPNWGKKKILIDNIGVFIVDDVNDLNDVLIQHDPTKYEIEAKVITWKEALDMLDKQQNITTDPHDDGFTEEDLNRNVALIIAKEIFLNLSSAKVSQPPDIKENAHKLKGSSERQLDKSSHIER